MNKKSFIDNSIEFDITNLPDKLKKLINELEIYNENNDWFNYDFKFDELEVDSRSMLIHKMISENDYKKILKKYGRLYD